MNFKKNLLSIILSSIIATGILGCQQPKKQISLINPKIDIFQHELTFLGKPKEIKFIIGYTDLFIKYESENNGPDFWQSPETTIKKRKGDCEDIAILQAYFAEKLGYKPQVLCLGNREKGKIKNPHTIALLEKKGLNNTKYGGLEKFIGYPLTNNSLHELINSINKIYDFKKSEKYDGYYVIDLNETDINWRTYQGNLKPVYIKLVDDNSK